MALIYIDTNVYLDFYQAATDRVAVFKEIQQRAKHIVFTEQTEHEFVRNRVARLATLKKEVQRSMGGQFFTTAIVRDMPEFEHIDKAQKEIKRLGKLVCDRLTSWIDLQNADPVLLEMTAIRKEAVAIDITESAIELAHRRKLLGDPPTSPDKHTIGDELIWELLCENCKDDLIVVSRDLTFHVHVIQLEIEYKKRTGKNLLKVTQSLAEALQLLGSESQAVKKAEQEIAKAKSVDAKELDGICPKCGGALEETGFEGGEGDEAWWLYCTKCGSEFFPK